MGRPVPRRQLEHVDHDFGPAPNRSFVVEWRNATFFPPGGPNRVDFEVVLHKNLQVGSQYRNIKPTVRSKGNSATIGIENAAGDDAFQYSFGEATIDAPSFAGGPPPPSGFVGTGNRRKRPPCDRRSHGKGDPGRKRGPADHDGCQRETTACSSCWGLHDRSEQHELQHQSARRRWQPMATW